MGTSKLTGLFGRRWWIFVSVAVVMALAFVVLRQHLHRYSATAMVLLVGQASDQVDTATAVSGGGGMQQALSPRDIPNLLGSSILLERVARDLHGAMSIDAIAGHIRARSSFGTNILPVSFSASNPDLATDGANAVARELERYSGEVSTQRFDLLIRNLQKQIQQKKLELASLDATLGRSINANPYIDEKSGYSVVNQALTTLEVERAKVSMAVAGDQAELASLGRGLLALQPIATHEIQQSDPAFKELDERYGLDLTKYEQAKATYSSSYPGLAELQSVAKSEKRSLQTIGHVVAARPPATSPTFATALMAKNQAAAHYAADEGQLRSINADMARLQGSLRNSTAAGGNVSSLRRQRDADELVYVALSERLASTSADRAAAASVGTVSIIDPAVGAGPELWTSTPVLGFAMFSAAVWLAFSLAMLADRSDSRLRTRTSVEDLYGHPVIATLGRR
jgi:uncharacterized protein involved in exopolysaccharide biosynthesis